MPIITVSREYGSGGSEVAARVAAALGWHLYDNDVVEQVAARLGVSSDEISAREERVPSLVERMTSAMTLGVPEAMPLAGDYVAHPTEERMLEVTQLVIEEAVRAGPAVVVGRGAQAVLANRKDALHVYCCSAFSDLVRYAVAHLGVSRADAPRRVQEVNNQRHDYVKRHWKREWRDPANYDLCVNTARLGLDAAAALVTSLAQERFGQQDRSGT